MESFANHFATLSNAHPTRATWVFVPTHASQTQAYERAWSALTGQATKARLISTRPPLG